MGESWDTKMGGSNAVFPETRWSRLLSAVNSDSQVNRNALQELCLRYWKPVFAFVRSIRSVGIDEAKDLTQDFLMEMIDGGLLERFTPERGSFRTYLKGAIRLFLREWHRDAQAQKRGGGRRLVSLDEESPATLEQIAVAPESKADTVFDQEWVHSLIDLAVDDLHHELTQAGKEIHFRVFEKHELRPPPEGAPSHQALADEFGVKASDVNHYLANCRKAMRERILNRLRDSVSSEQELQDEIRTLFES